MERGRQKTSATHRAPFGARAPLHADGQNRTLDGEILAHWLRRALADPPAIQQLADVVARASAGERLRRRPGHGASVGRPNLHKQVVPRSGSGMNRVEYTVRVFVLVLRHRVNCEDLEGKVPYDES